GRGPLIGPGQPERIQPLGQVIADQRLAEKIARGTAVAPLRSLAPQVLPLFDRAVATPETHQRDQIDLFVFGHGIDEAGDLAHNGIVAIILEHIEPASIAPRNENATKTWGK